MINDLDNKIIQAEDSLARNLDWIGRHDSRIAFTAGILLAMLGVLASASASVVAWTWYTYLSFSVTAGSLFLGIIFIYFSQYPKTESRNSSLIYFGTVAGLKCDEFKKRFKETNREDYLDDLLSQVHINAEILQKKFGHLKLSLCFLAIAVLPWLFSIYLSGLYLKQ
jgi:hypothetical protein